MKRIAAVIMVFALLAGLCSCSVKKEGTDKTEKGEKEAVSVSSSSTAPTTTTTTKKTVKQNTAPVTPDGKARIINSVLVTDKYALEMYYHDDANAKNYANIINKTAAALPEGVKFYSMLVPTAVEFYGTENYRTGSRSQRDSISKAYSFMDDSVITVDAYSYLVDRVEDYIYFRSDHHWTARGAYCGYQAFCEASDNEAPALESFGVHNIDGFLGTLYDTTHADVLRNNPDTVECFELAVEAENKIYTSADMNEQTAFTSYVVASKVSGSNKYLAFIAGDQPLEKITTSVKNGKKILVLKESFGNAFVPFLCNNYEEIYVVDPRHIEFNLPSFVSANGISEVLAVNYTFCMGNSVYCNAMNKLS